MADAFVFPSDLKNLHKLDFQVPRGRVILLPSTNSQDLCRNVFNRQKLLLALLEALGGKLGATDFQKLLFLFTSQFEKSRSYEFVPYRFGCYSFQASADKRRLIKDRFLEDDSQSWQLKRKNINHGSVLRKDECKRIEVFAERYSSLRGEGLIRYVYTNYPYFAINSEIAKEILTEAEVREVAKARPTRRRSRAFFTIGYEGGCVETYINQLIRNDIRMLVDVRRNAISRKYGFSKRTLSGLLDGVGVKYVHMPSLGIDSAERKELRTQSDYDRLLDRYERKTLNCQKESLAELVQLYEMERRIAITCFEREHSKCHRGRIASAIESRSGGEIDVVHV